MENLKKEIEQLKQEKNAVLLAHYYVDDAVQEIADYVGDSYYLAKVALKESGEASHRQLSQVHRSSVSSHKERGQGLPSEQV